MSEPASPEPPRRAWIRWLLLAILISCVAGFYLLGYHEHFSFQNVRREVVDLQAQVDEHLVLAIVLFFVLYVIMAAFSVPAAWIMTVVAGALFGRFLGAGVALLAATVGATLAFLSARFLFGQWVQSRFGAKLGALNRGFKADGAFYLFSLRLVIVVPFFLVNLAMGLTPIRTWTYFWVSLIGMAPGSLIYANAGFELASVREAKDIVSPSLITAIALLGIAPLVFRKALQWMRSEPEA